MKEQTFKILNSIITLAICIELCVAGYLYAMSNPAMRQTIVLATTVQPERFTELYFENHLQLPATVSDNKTIVFSFTVHNLEYRDTTYPYEVYMLEKGRKTLIAYNHFTLKQDQYKTINELYTFGRPIDRAQIVVNLVNKKQHIDFWVKGENEKK